jgi:hypothetical protein
MKRLVFIIALVLSMSFCAKAAINWKGINYKVKDRTISESPFIKGGLWIGNNSESTVYVSHSKMGFSSTSNISAGASLDFYPLAWNVQRGDSVTLSASASSDVEVIWYEIND